MTSKDFQVKNGAVVNTALTVNSTFIANSANVNVIGVPLNITGDVKATGNVTALNFIGTLVGGASVTSVSVPNSFFANSTNVYSNIFFGIWTNAPQYSLDIANTDAIRVPVGNTAQRPTANNGVIRFNTDSGLPEFCVLASSWIQFSQTQLFGETGAL